MVWNLNKAEESESVARAILSAHSQARVFALHGELGAGKTTLIKGFCAALGVLDQASSPSFAIVNEYRSTMGGPVYHFDLYRLKNTSELEGVGFSEYLDSHAHCFIEWPELAGGLLPEDTVHLRIALQPDGTRHIAAHG
ncbi:MAG: tRNA (adenosine(37)-N6)-threonylcarbamoyltransferase complex ATPase subunit type 1 TsaE [Flavobacteriales bacterium]|nr:tRNA (adenosine(37)-N6)-threonylcarbamoyltransferase complex ATPase subunit type 1 TsaE [Flavobacteriales bacterium]